LSVTKNQLSNLVIKDIQDTTEKEKAINDLDQTISTLQNSLKTCFQQASEVNSNLATLKANKGFELDRKQKIANGICPTCLQKVSTAATTDLETKIQQITAEIDHLEKKLQEIEISKKGIDADITVKQSQQQQEKQELVSIQKENTNIEHNIELKSVLEKNVVNLQKAIEAEKATADNLEAVYKDSVEDRSVEIVELQNNLNNFENQKSEVLQKQNLKSIAEANLVDCKNHLQLLSADIEKNAKDVQQAEQTLKAIEKGTADWSKVQEAFNLIPKLHLKTFLDDIETVCSSIAARFGYKGILIDSDEKGIEFFLQDWPLADVESADTPYEMCSGFEKNLVNLSLVYALSRMFRVPFVCIDELDASADTENTAKLGELVKLILQYTPVVTVSHDNNLISDLLQSNYKVSILKTVEEKQ
jgi:DNA repair exonuclease SbcCD ATPase subunit